MVSGQVLEMLNADDDARFSAPSLERRFAAATLRVMTKLKLDILTGVVKELHRSALPLNNIK